MTQPFMVEPIAWQWWLMESPSKKFVTNDPKAIPRATNEMPIKVVPLGPIIAALATPDKDGTP